MNGVLVKMRGPGSWARYSGDMQIELDTAVTGTIVPNMPPNQANEILVVWVRALITIGTERTEMSRYLMWMAPDHLIVL